MSHSDNFIFFCLLESCFEGAPFEDGGVPEEVAEEELGDLGPTDTIREPNSTPMVTSWEGEKRPSQRRIVREDFPVPESPIQTSFAI